mgnify:CR=1 FL=1
MTRLSVVKVLKSVRSSINFKLLTTGSSPAMNIDAHRYMHIKEVKATITPIPANSNAKRKSVSHKEYYQPPHLNKVLAI